MTKHIFEDIKGIKAIFAKNPDWPNSCNIFAIPDEKGFSVIDIGCGGDKGLAFLEEGLTHWGLKLEDLHTVVLSHAHTDHMGAIKWVMEKVEPEVKLHSLDVEVAADPTILNKRFDLKLAQDRMGEVEGAGNFEQFEFLSFFKNAGCTMSGVSPVTEMNEGDVIELGDFAFDVYHTPGHALGHVCLHDKNKGILFAGDMIGKMVALYTPTAGGLTGYLDCLDKLEPLEAEVILTSHGPSFDNPTEILQKVRGKLIKRDERIMGLLKEGPKTFTEINRELFKIPFLQFFPGCVVTESHILKLEKDGVVTRENGKIKLT